MWFYRSQLWNIKLGRAPHVSRFMWKKNLLKNDHTASEQNSFFWECDFQTLWCYQLIFDQSLMIHLEIFGQWVSAAYKQRGSILPKGRSDDDMIAKVWSMASDAGVWDYGTKAISPLAVIIKKASDDGLNQGLSMNQSSHLWRNFPWMDWIMNKLFNPVWERKGNCLQWGVKTNPPTFQSHPTPPGWGGWWSKQHLCLPF